MGQAKQRGARAERVAAANENNMRKLSEVIAELGIPKESGFLGYVLHNQMKDDYLLSVRESDQIIRSMYTMFPEKALRFDDHRNALKVCSRFNGDLLIGLLFDAEDKYIVGFAG